MDPLYNPLRTRPIQMGREMSIEPYPNRQFGFIDNPDRQSGTSSVWTWIRTWTRTQTRSDGPEPLLILVVDLASLVAVDRASLVGVQVASLGASW